MQRQVFPEMYGANQNGAHTLYGVTLSANPVSTEMVKMLNEELKKQSRVRLLRHQSCMSRCIRFVISVYILIHHNVPTLILIHVRSSSWSIILFNLSKQQQIQQLKAEAEEEDQTKKKKVSVSATP